nr:FAD-binding domain-containing protein [Halobellus salinus]
MDAPAVRLGDRPRKAAIPRFGPDESGTVVWHREHLRVRDHPAVAAAAADADHFLPVFVFDPSFYGATGVASDARIGFLHDCLADLYGQYRAAADAGLTLAHGDPIEVLGRFRDAGWDVVAAASLTGRYGLERDRRARAEVGVSFVDGDGLVRGVDRPRDGWSDRVEAWLTDDHDTWDPDSVSVHAAETGVTIDGVDAAYGIDPEKSKVPDGGTTPARRKLAAFVDRIRAYPGTISAPVDARGGTSGLSPHLKFGCLSVRQVYQCVVANAPACRGTDMFVSRLFWNKHYEQKLEDWPGWLDSAVNPVLKGFNADRRDDELIAAWKAGETGYPMVDASMRCLAETGWINSRMRALCASFYRLSRRMPRGLTPWMKPTTREPTD